MKRVMTEAERHAKEVCKNLALREGDYDCYVIRFSSHPATFKNNRTGETVTLNTGYGLYFKDDGSVYCNSALKPYNSYFEALANIGNIAWKHDMRKKILENAEMRKKLWSND